MRKQVPLSGALTAKARGWDRISLGDWAQRKLQDQGRAHGARPQHGAGLRRRAGRAVAALLPELHAGGRRLGRADRVRGRRSSRSTSSAGRSRSACGLAEELGESVVLEAPVEEVTQDGEQVVVRTASASFEAERVVIAVAPAVAGAHPLLAAAAARARRARAADVHGRVHEGNRDLRPTVVARAGHVGAGVPRLPARADGRRCERRRGPGNADGVHHRPRRARARPAPAGGTARGRPSARSSRCSAPRPAGPPSTGTSTGTTSPGAAAGRSG